MLVLLWLVRIYKWMLIAWVLMTWIPFVGGSSFHALLGIPILPVLNLFSFLQLGPLGFQALIPMLILHFTEGWLERQVTGKRDASTEQRGPAGDPSTSEEHQSKAD